jgi:tetratricopeptide (TPR) repeat protein
VKQLACWAWLPLVAAALGAGKDPIPVLHGVRIDAQTNALVVRFSPPFSPRVASLDSPHRLVLDVRAISELPGAPALRSTRVDRWGIREIRTSQYRPGAEPITRVVIELGAKPSWKRIPESGAIVIRMPGLRPDAAEPIWIGSDAETLASETATSPATDRASPLPTDAAPTTIATAAVAADTSAAAAEAKVESTRTAATVGDTTAVSNATAAAAPGTSAGVDAPAAASPAAASPAAASPATASPATANRRAATTASLAAGSDSTAPPAVPRAASAPTPAAIRVERDDPPSPHQVWDARADQLVDAARLAYESGDPRGALAKLYVVEKYYDGTPAAAAANLLFGRVFCETHQPARALERLTAVLRDTLASPSLANEAVATTLECPLDDPARDLLSDAYLAAAERLGRTEAVVMLGGRLGVALAEAGEETERALVLLGAALTREHDGPGAAELHRALGVCREREGNLDRAAREHLFAARLLAPTDPHGEMTLRLRAADDLFQADDIEAAAQQYEAVGKREKLPERPGAWAWFQLGNCHYRMRRFALASAAYRELRTRYPSSFWSEQAVTRLAMIERSGFAAR